MRKTEGQNGKSGARTFSTPKKRGKNESHAREINGRKESVSEVNPG